MIHPQLSRLYKIARSKIVTTNDAHLASQEKFNIDGVTFQVNYQMMLVGPTSTGSTRNYRPTEIPGSHHKFPAVAYITIPNGGFNSVELEVLQEMSNKLKHALKQYTVMCFYSPGTGYVGPSSVLTSKNEDAVERDLSGGAWFTADGLGFPIGTEDNAPALYLSRHANSLVANYPKVREWVMENPPPKSNMKSILNWYRKLGTQFIANDWHLLWNGVAFTQDTHSMSEDLANLGEDAMQYIKDWPSNSIIDVCRMPRGSFSKVTWSELVGSTGNQAVQELDDILLGNCKDVYREFQDVIDAVQPE